ncbi:Nn.00g079470.m01.CDS01 [Neocucurbitaria sp. VM-36]
MAEAIGVVASIVTILDLAGKVMGYLHSTSHIDDEQHRLRTEISDSVVVLMMFKARLSDASPHAPSLQTTRALAGPGGPLMRFKTDLETVAGIVIPEAGSGRLKSTVDKLTWPVKKTKVNELMASLNRQKSLFKLALEDDHMSISLTLQGSVEDLGAKVDNVANVLDDVSLEQKDTASAEISAAVEKRRIEEWLSPLDFGVTQTDTLRRRHTDTCTWVLDSSEFKTWMSTPGGVLWCPGVAGAGKTVISAIVVDHLHRTFTSQEAAVLCIYFKFQNNEQHARNVTGALLRQLSESRARLSPELKQAFQQHRNGQTRLGGDEMSNLLRSEAAQFPRAFIVVDALDESSVTEGTQKAILSELNLLMGVANVFATSRPLPSIATHFVGHPRLSIRAEDKDIQTYISGRLYEEPSLSSFLAADKDLVEEVEKIVVGKVQGIFLLAELHLNSLASYDNLRQLRKALTTLPIDYDSTFEDAIKRVKQQGNHISKRAMQMLSWVTNAYQPLTLTELQHALAVEIGAPEFYPDAIVDSNHLVSICCGLVAVDKGSQLTRLVHYTLEEYLSQRKEELFPGSSDEMTGVCLTYLSFDTFASGPAGDDSTMETRLKDYPFISSAAMSWGRYAVHARPRTMVHVREFLKREGNRHSAVQGMSVAGEDTSERNWSQNFPRNASELWLAAHFGLCELATSLLQDGAEVDQEDGWGWTPLFVATENEHTNMVTLLLNAGASVHHIENDGYNVVGVAVWSDNIGLVNLFNNKGANLKHCNNNGETLLHESAWWGAEKVSEALLSLGFDVAALDKEGCTALHHAIDEGSMAISTVLLEKGLRATHKDKQGNSVLFKAIKKGRADMVSLLLKYGASANEVIPQYRTYDSATQAWTAKGKIIGGTPILAASDLGLEDILNILIEHGADVQTHNTEGETAIFEAAEGGHSSLIAILIGRGVDPSKSGNHGKTPLHAACWGGHTDAVATILGAASNIAVSEDDLVAALKSSNYSVSKSDLIKNLLRESSGTQITEAVVREATAAAGVDANIWSIMLDFDSTIVISEKNMLQLATHDNGGEIIELFSAQGLSYPLTARFVGTVLTTYDWYFNRMLPKLSKLHIVEVTSEVLFIMVEQLYSFRYRERFERIIDSSHYLRLTESAIGFLAVNCSFKQVEPLIAEGSRITIPLKALGISPIQASSEEDLENIRLVIDHPRVVIDEAVFIAVARRHRSKITQALLGSSNCPLLSEAMVYAVASYGTMIDFEQVIERYNGAIDVDRLVSEVGSCDVSAKVDLILERFVHYRASEKTLALYIRDGMIFEKLLSTNPDFLITEQLLIELIRNMAQHASPGIELAAKRKMNITLTNELLDAMATFSRGGASAARLLGRHPDEVVAGPEAVMHIIKLKQLEIARLGQKEAHYTYLWNESIDWNALMELAIKNIKASEVSESIACEVASHFPDGVAIIMLEKHDISLVVTRQLFNVFAACRGDMAVAKLLARSRSDTEQPSLDVQNVFQRFEPPTITLILDYYPEIMVNEDAMMWATKNMTEGAPDLLSLLWNRSPRSTMSALKLLKSAIQNATSALGLAKVILLFEPTLDISQNVLRRAARHRDALLLFQLFKQHNPDLIFSEQVFCTAVQREDDVPNVLQALFTIMPSQLVTEKMIYAVITGPGRAYWTRYRSDSDTESTLNFLLSRDLAPNLIVTRGLAVTAPRYREEDGLLELLIRKIGKVDKDALIPIVKRFGPGPVKALIDDLHVPVIWTPSLVKLVSRNRLNHVSVMKALLEREQKALDPRIAALAPYIMRRFHPNVVRIFLYRFWQGPLTHPLLNAAVKNKCSTVKFLKRLLEFDPDIRFTSKDLAAAIKAKRGKHFVNFIMSHGCQDMLTLEITRLTRRVNRRAKRREFWWSNGSEQEDEANEDIQPLGAEATLRLVEQTYRMTNRHKFEHRPLRLHLSTRYRHSPSFSSSGDDSNSSERLRLIKAGNNGFPYYDHFTSPGYDAPFPLVPI